MKKVTYRTLKVATPEEYQKWIENKTKQLLKRLPSLKKKLSLFDDRTNEFYTLTESEITLMSKVYRGEVASGKLSKGGEEFVFNLNKFTTTSTKQLQTEYTNKRFQEWYNYAITNAVDDREVALINELVNGMSEDDKNSFTRSKYFFVNDYVGCTSLDMFEKEYEISVATAKLENFLDDRRGRTGTTTYDAIREEMGKDKHKVMYKPRKRKK